MLVEIEVLICWNSCGGLRLISVCKILFFLVIGVTNKFTVNCVWSVSVEIESIFKNWS